MFPNRIEIFRSAGVSPASENAGETPAHRFVGRAIPWLTVAALVVAWSDVPLAQAAPKQQPAKKAVSPSDPFSAEPNSGKQPAKNAASTYSGRTNVIPGTLKVDPSITKTGAGTLVIGGKLGAGTLVIGGGIGEFPATLDQALTMALESSPKVMAAKARVTLAEAELSSAQMDVARKIVELWTERQTKQLTYDNMRERPGGYPAPFLIEAGAAVTQVEMELRCLIGQASASAFRGGLSTRTATVERPAKPLQLPRGRLVERIRQALLMTTEVVFVEAPMQEVMDYLKEKHKIEIQFDTKALEDAHTGSDRPLTIDLKGLALADFFQSLDDREPELKFVVRNYGILVTTPERAREQGYFPVVDFARLAAGGETQAETPRDLQPATPPANRR